MFAATCFAGEAARQKTDKKDRATNKGSPLHSPAHQLYRGGTVIAGRFGKKRDGFNRTEQAIVCRLRPPLVQKRRDSADDIDALEPRVEQWLLQLPATPRWTHAAPRCRFIAKKQNPTSPGDFTAYRHHH